MVQYGDAFSSLFISSQGDGDTLPYQSLRQESPALFFAQAPLWSLLRPRGFLSQPLPFLAPKPSQKLVVVGYGMKGL